VSNTKLARIYTEEYALIESLACNKGVTMAEAAHELLTLACNRPVTSTEEPVYTVFCSVCKCEHLAPAHSQP
jgi:hypothetical protein